VNSTDESTGSVETDGGSPIDADIFTREAKTEDISSVQRFKRVVDAYLYAPLAVAAEDTRTLVGGGILLAFVLMATVGVVVVDPPKTMEGPLFLPPFQNWQFPLGTGGLGKDLFSQVIHSAPGMLIMILSGALLSIGIGTIIGTVAGYKGGRIDKILMGLTDVVLTIPSLALVIVLAAIYRPERAVIVGLILGIDNWPRLARTVRSQVLSIREEAFTEASRIMGLSQTTLFRKDIISNLMPYISVNFANSSRRIIFESVGLYFLGVLPFTSLNWGVMLNEAYENISLTNPARLYVILIPMIVIVIVSLGFVLFAQGLDRVFNVRLRARHAKTVGDEEGTG
jgi:peptide/nickel transport system permease protein